MEINEKILDLIDGIKNNTTDGASELARHAVMVIKTAAETSEAGTARELLLELKETGRLLIAARSTMAPVSNIVTRMMREIMRENRKDDPDDARQQVVRLAEELYRDSENAVAAIANHTADLIENRDVILTHSYSSTVKKTITGLYGLKSGIKVIVTKSGTGRSGERTARELSVVGIPVVYIDDTAIGLYISGVSKVLTGADRITADGKVINGAGTYQVALAAEKGHIPFYVLCETLKFDFSTDSSGVDLEERGDEGLAEPGTLPDEVIVSNPTFDITPLDMITGIVTENGLISPGNLGS